jgi:purine-binding chemotaxis protein CheW
MAQEPPLGEPLAAANGGEEGDYPRAELLLFALAGERYALAVEQVSGVEERRPITSVPGAPACVLGVFSRRGDVLPALDLAQLLLGQPGPTDGGYLLVGQSSSGPAGLLVGEVEAVVAIDPAALQPPLPTLDPARARLAQGQVQVDGHWVTVLDLERVVAAIAAAPQGG